MKWPRRHVTHYGVLHTACGASAPYGNLTLDGAHVTCLRCRRTPAYRFRPLGDGAAA